MICYFIPLQIDVLTLHAMLTDFGLAKVMTDTKQIGTRTMLTGSPGFQPPEQLRAECVGVECDVYVFGAVLLVVFTERLLWKGHTPYQVMCKVTVNNAVPDTTALNHDMQVVCNNCFKERVCRPNSPEVLRALLAIKY